MATTASAAQVLPGEILLPRVTIQFCTQCKWMLRAAYFAQELLSTFSTALGEVALQPSTGGTFIVTITHATNTTADPQDGSHDAAGASGSAPGSESALAAAGSTGSAPASVAPGPTTTSSKVLWDRRIDGGFPETKELKRRVRDVIEPGRDLGHVDRHRGGVADKDASSKTEQADARTKPETDVKGGEQPDPKGDKKVCEDCN